jgi:Sulfotransferase family
MLALVEFADPGDSEMKRSDVRAAYVEVFGREVDPEGLRHWSRQDLDYDQLCTTLRLSDEYIDNHIDPSLRPKIRAYFVWPYPQLFVATNVKILYCPIAKSGCTALKRVMIGISDIKDRDRILRRKDLSVITDSSYTGIQLKDLSLDDKLEAIEGNNYYRFSVLRHPEARILSAYWEKFVVNRRVRINLVHTGPVVEAVYRGKGYGRANVKRGITFNEFVSYIASSDPIDLDPHWKPQHLFLQGVDYDDLYDLRDLTALYDRLTDLCGHRVRPIAENVTNSGIGRYVEGAGELLPRRLMTLGPISRDSFFNDEIRATLAPYFERDYELVRDGHSA